MAGNFIAGNGNCGPEAGGGSWESPVLGRFFVGPVLAKVSVPDSFLELGDGIPLGSVH